MLKTNFNHVYELIELANQKKIRLSISENKIKLHYSKDIKPSEDFLDKIKNNREILLKYLESITNDPSEQKKQLENRSDKLLYEFKTYYKITSIHKQYWYMVDAGTKFMDNLEVFQGCKIVGKFDRKIFEQAIRQLIERHETLRSSFHKIDSQYYVQIEDIDYKKYFLFKQISETQSMSEDYINDFVYFKDHHFEIEYAPLFLVRLVQLKNLQFILSFKLHHIIYDKWSIEILIRDLFAFYFSLLVNERPKLPKLVWQYKDYIYLQNCYKDLLKYTHMLYWKETYKSVSKEIFLPGEKPFYKTKPDTRLGKMIYFDLSKELVYKVDVLSKKYQTNNFIILMASFKNYLSKTIDHNEITIGTELFNRSFQLDYENQIGPFAQSYVLTTLINPEDSFSAIVEKVKKSYQNMKMYDAFTLLDAYDEMRLDNQIFYRPYWKITLNFENNTTSNLSNLVVDDLEKSFKMEKLKDKQTPVYVNKNLELKFVKEKDRMELYVIYDLNLYDHVTIDIFFVNYLRSLEKVDMLGSELQ